MSQENVEMAKAALGAFNEGGVEALLPYLDPNIEWVSVPGFLPDAEDRVGHEGVREWFATISEPLNDLRWEPLEFIDAGNRVVIAARIKATGRASGIDSEFVLHHVATVRDGKAVRLESYTEQSQALEAAGLR